MPIRDTFRKMFSPKTEARTSTDLTSMSSAVWAMIGNTHVTNSGELINETSAVANVVVYTCARVIAESVGQLTFRLYSRQGKGRNEEFSNPIHRILALEPNEDMSATTLWGVIAASMAITGNAFAMILRNTAGDPVGLYPLDARRTEPVRLMNKKLAYRTYVEMTNSDGSTSANGRIINAEDMLAFPLWSFDGLRGLSPIQQGMQSIGLAKAVEKFGAQFFGNGSHPSGILTPIKEVSEEDLQNMKHFWEMSNSAANQGRIATLPSDWKFTPLSISPEESQFLQTQQLSRTQIAGLFRLPPHMIGDTTRMSNTNHEQEALTFVIDTLGPYLKSIESEINRKLLPRDGSLFVEADRSERLKGDFASTMQGIAVGRQNGIFSINDGREKLGENPIGPEGDVYIVPVNYVNAKAIVDQTSVPSQDEQEARTVVRPYITAFSALYTDAVGRVTQRSKRDVETIQSIFSPVLDSLVSIFTEEARSRFNLKADWTPSDKILREYVKSISSRSADWKAEEKSEIATVELTKAIRSIQINIFREAGAAVALTNEAA